MSDALKIVTHEDAASAKKPLTRTTEHEAWIDADSSRLTDLLDDIDGLKYEIHERMRRIEAVKQAKSVLLEDAVKTEALNKKLAELGRAMGGVHTGLRGAEARHDDAEPLRMQPRESLREAESRHSEAKSLPEGAALPWRKPEEPEDSLVNTYQAQASQLLETFNGYRENSQAATDASIAFSAAAERLEHAEQVWKQANQAVLEAKQLLDQSASELVQTRRKEEAVLADIQSVRQEFTTAYQSATQHLEEAEQFWKQGDQASVEAKKMLDQSIFHLTQARSKEESASADLLSARQELTTAYQFAAVAAQRRLDAVELFQKAARWAVFVVALSWIAMAWMAWLTFRMIVPIWGPCIVTAILVGLAIALGRRGTREA